MMVGEVNITWSPAFVFGLDEKIIWCGDYTYDVFFARGGFDFAGKHFTGDDLFDLAATDDYIDRFETTDLGLILDGLVPGAKYTILVTARTDRGHFSFNREGAQVAIATTNPELSSSFTRMVILPEPGVDAPYEIENGDGVVTFIGESPDGLIGLEPEDYVYFFDSDGNATLGRTLQQMDTGEGGDVAWEYTTAQLDEVFNQLEVTVGVASDKSDLDAIEDLVDFEED